MVSHDGVHVRKSVFDMWGLGGEHSYTTPYVMLNLVRSGEVFFEAVRAQALAAECVDTLLDTLGVDCTRTLCARIRPDALGQDTLCAEAVNITHHLRRLSLALSEGWIVFTYNSGYFHKTFTITVNICLNKHFNYTISVSGAKPLQECPTHTMYKITSIC